MSWTSPRQALPTSAYWALALVGLILPLLGWVLLSAAELVDPVFMPGPGQVLARMMTWLVDDDLLGDMAISTWRVVAGWALSAVIALPLGLCIGSWRAVQALLEPLTDFIRYMPAVAFIPLVMLWVGIDEGAKVAIIFIGTFFQMVLMVAEDVRRVPMAQIEAAQTMGAQHPRGGGEGHPAVGQAGLARHLARDHGLGLDLPRRGRAGGRQLGPGFFHSEGAALPSDRQDLCRHLADRLHRLGPSTSSSASRTARAFPWLYLRS